MDYTQGFPHLTPSKTGSHNPRQMLDFLGIEDVTAHYVTRPYVTRHGAGPLPHRYAPEDFAELFPRFSDETNVDNRWQGSLRFGRLCSQGICHRIATDWAFDSKWHKKVHVTCADQGESMVFADALGRGYAVPLEEKAAFAEFNRITDSLEKVELHHVE